MRSYPPAFPFDHAIRLERKLLSIPSEDCPRVLIDDALTEASLSSSRLAVVLVRAGKLFCALPLASVIETLRSPPITAYRR